MPHSFTTDRLLLRPIRVRDARAFHALCHDRAATRMTATWVYPFTEETVRARFAAFAAQDQAQEPQMAICTPAGFAGMIGLFHNMSCGTELGYWVGRDLTGRGLATEAVQAFCRFAFRSLGVERIDACVFTDNPASVAVLRKTGFRQHAGVSEGWSACRGRASPIYTFHLTPKAGLP